MYLSRRPVRTAAILVICAAGLLLVFRAQETTDTATAEITGDVPEFSYEGYDALLHTYVSTEGIVDYKGLIKDRAALDDFNRSLSGIDKADYESWSESEKIALWINAYNSITLQYVIDNYPIEKGGFVSSFRYPENSIRQIPGVWDKLKMNVANRNVTLEEIEHKILRADFDEPRLHVSIVCASGGCPPLRNEAFVPDKLEAQLDDQAKRFLAEPTKFRIDREKGKVLLSPIFNWFGRDFISRYGSDKRFAAQGRAKGAVLSFISGYVAQKDLDFLLNGEYSIAYQDYDWSLNE